MTTVATWIAGFVSRMTETREMDQLLQRLSDALDHPCHSSILAALKKSWESVMNEETNHSTRWAQVVVDFSWEMLNVGNWKDVSMAWRELYSAATLLKALSLCAARDFQTALREIDKGILLGAPLFNNVLPSVASLLNSEIRTAEGRAMDTGVETEQDNGLPSCEHVDRFSYQGGHLTPSPLHSPQEEARQLKATSAPSRKVVFKNYLPFQRHEVTGSEGVSFGINKRNVEGQRCIGTRVVRPSRPYVGVKGSHDARSLTPYHLQTKDMLARKIPVLYCPSLEVFMDQCMTTSAPVVLSGCMDQWPAYAAKKWSLSYLKQIAGSRTVPVELGSRYTDEDWSQKLMTLAEFIDGYVDTKDDSTAPKGYLAQHQLFDQIPELSHDFSIPEYCYLSTSRSGGVHSEVKVNAWFGPRGTLSPLHFDPDHNLLSQIVGRKHIRLYGEDQSAYLYPHEGILSNTSQVDIERPDLHQFPLFSKASCMECVLYPGHMLYIPPRCWHHVRSLDISFSVSFWWS